MMITSVFSVGCVWRRSNLTRWQRTLLGALITIDVHARDVVRLIVQKKISVTSDFEWTRQLRYGGRGFSPHRLWDLNPKSAMTWAPHLKLTS